MKQHITVHDSTPIQLKLPVDLERKIKISDAIYSFSKIMAQIDPKKYFAEELSVDMNHVYIDGTKLEANAQKYTWVWKKSCIHSRNNVFCKLNELFNTMNETVFAKFGMTAELRQEYSVEYVEYILREYLHLTGMSVSNFVHGSGKRKSAERIKPIVTIRFLRAISDMTKTGI